MASLIAILDLKGKPLIQRSYRDDVPPSYVERFLPLVLEIEEDGQQVTPCFSSQGVNYMHIRHSNLYLLALSKRNSNAAEIIIFLHRLTQVLIEYFKELEEESIRDNFVIIYELMDEMMDFGYPQTTESKILQEYITQESYKLEVQVRPPMAVTNAVSWRTEGIRYRKNEVFLDVIESVNMLVNANGNVVRSEILGAIKMKCYLSGMPELRLGLNDKVMFESTGRTARGKAIEMEDVKFHQCVRLSRFENDRTISFIPPDGEFELMSYRLSTPVKPLVWVEAAVESHKGSRVEYVVKVKAQFKRRSTANNVEIYVPVPDDADSPKFRASTGTVQYAPDKSAFVWKIKQLGGSREFLMRAHFGLPSVKSENDLDKRAPITVKFEIPYFTVSGIQVRYLKIVEKSGYQALPWVRYITQNGDDYSLRTALEKGNLSAIFCVSSSWTMASTSSSAISLPVVLTTKTPYPLPSQKFMIPATWRRYQLSQLVNKALSLANPVPFDFLVRGEILRTTLGEWCTENGVGEEETLEIEYIESVLPPEKISDFPHEDWVSSASCKVPGQFFTASYDGYIRSFDYSKNATSSTLAHSAAISSICVLSSSDDTHTVASASLDLTAQLNQITLSPPGPSTSSKFTPLATLHLHTAPLSSITSNTTGTRLLTASWDGLIGLWDTTVPDKDEVPEEVVSERGGKKKRRRVEEGTRPPRKAPVEVLKSHVGRVSGVVFAPGQEEKAYSCGFDSTVRVWDTERCVSVHTITASNKAFLSLSALSMTPENILATSTDRTMMLYDVRLPSPSDTNAPASFLHPATPSCVAALESGSQQVVSGAYDGVVRLWDLRSTKGAVASFSPWEKGVKVLCVEWGRGVIAVGGEGGFSVWKVGENVLS
ncbi:hypothetical protein C0995_006382 [Termitomyces sp. Mi166|nr:hypothetical protein C0995_006382 [Termitomyces sp. Mi166\